MTAAAAGVAATPSRSDVGLPTVPVPTVTVPTVTLPAPPPPPVPVPTVPVPAVTVPTVPASVPAPVATVHTPAVTAPPAHVTTAAPAPSARPASTAGSTVPAPAPANTAPAYAPSAAHVSRPAHRSTRTAAVRRPRAQTLRIPLRTRGPVYLHVRRAGSCASFRQRRARTTGALALTRRLGARRLAPGLYELAVSTDAAGRNTVKRLAFRIPRRGRPTLAAHAAVPACTPAAVDAFAAVRWAPLHPPAATSDAPTPDAVGVAGKILAAGETHADHSGRHTLPNPVASIPGGDGRAAAIVGWLLIAACVATACWYGVVFRKRAPAS